MFLGHTERVFLTREMQCNGDFLPAHEKWRLALSSMILGRLRTICAEASERIVDKEADLPEPASRCWELPTGRRRRQDPERTRKQVEMRH